MRGLKIFIIILIIAFIGGIGYFYMKNEGVVGKKSEANEVSEKKDNSDKTDNNSNNESYNAILLDVMNNK